MTRKNGSYIFKRIFSVILALAFSLTAVPVWTGAAETVSTYAAEEQTGEEYNGQTETGVYTISTPDQLELLAKKVNDGNSYAGSTFKLVAEIDLSEKYNKANQESWVPIGGGQKYPFSGTFDGGKNQITGLYMDVNPDLVSGYGVRYGFTYPCFGLFGYVNGVIQNLRVEGDISTEEVKGIYDSGNHVGGIVGYNIGTVKECEYYGTITTGYDVESIGGIVGYNGEGSTIEYCTYNGDIEITDADGREPSNIIGGIVGTNSGRVVECRNTGSITSEIKEPSAKIQIRGIGGIVGRAEEGSIIENCRNTGDINIKAIYPGSSVSGIGGIVGGITAEVKNCTNEGNITVEFEGVGESMNIGGISGSISDWGDDFIKVTGCTNTGEIKAENGRNVGGISASLGMAGISGTMTDCINQGTVQGSEYIGGIVGYMRIAEVIKCYNIGAVSGNDNTGGVVGSMENAEVIKCYNIGTVSGNNDAGGVVGYLYDENVTVQSCYYLDTCGAAGEGTSATKTQFNSGEIAYLLQEDWSGQVWGQQLSGSKNSYPIFTDKSEEKVLKVTFVTDDNTEYYIGYANPNGTVEIMPQDPTPAEGYVFGGWSLARDEWKEFTKVGNDNISVYAFWKTADEDTAGGGNTGDNTGGGTSQQPSTGTTPPSSGNTSEPSTGDSTEPSDENGAGNVTVNSESGENAPNVSISEETSAKLKEEIIAEHLTPEEKAAIESGDSLDVILVVEDAGDTVPAEDKQVTEAVLTNTEYTIGMYLNIDLIKLINGQQVGKITEISSPIRVTIEIPEELRSAHRAFAIVRVHDGAAEILKDVDDDPDTITIVTDKFSTYSIAYQDNANPGTGTTTPISILAISCAVIVAAVAVKRKKITE